MSDMNNDPRLQLLVTVAFGAVAGTLIKAFARPESNWRRWMVQATVSLAIGLLGGASIVQWMEWEDKWFLAVSAGTVSAFLAEEIVRGIQAYGRRLSRGHLEHPFKGGEHDDH